MPNTHTDILKTHHKPTLVQDWKEISAEILTMNLLHGAIQLHPVKDLNYAMSQNVLQVRDFFTKINHLK